MKGIILAGGSGTRLKPATNAVSKQLLPVFDKPLFYYPLSVLMMCGIRDILIISTPHDIDSFKRCVGDGVQLGLNIDYMIQPSPDGLAQAFILGEKFIGDDDVALILGDNIFFGEDLSAYFDNFSKNVNGSTIFAKEVNDPERFGIVEIGQDGKPVSIVEKPKNPMSNLAVIGLYFYKNNVVSYAKQLKPSERGELEITDLNNIYLKNNDLNVEVLDSDISWIDAGTHLSLLEASNEIRNLELNKNIKISCLEEIAFKNKWIDEHDIMEAIASYKNSSYGEYLKRMLKK